MERTKIEGFKEVMKKGMVENFKRDGFLTPVLFFYRHGQPEIAMIPQEFLNSVKGKNTLAQIIRDICTKPDVLAAGMIFEAYGAKISIDSQEAHKLAEGELKISQLKDRDDLIVMIFTTAESEESFSYVVDCENKTVGEMFGGEALQAVSGTFSHFFNWAKN